VSALRFSPLFRVSSIQLSLLPAQDTIKEERKPEVIGILTRTYIVLGLRALLTITLNMKSFLNKFAKQTMFNFSTPDTNLVRIYKASTLKMKNNDNLQFLNENSFSPLELVGYFILATQEESSACLLW